MHAVEQAMDEGAFGLSTGLQYIPGCYAPADEILAMARAVGRRGGLYASHLRSEGAELLEAIDEAIAIGRASGTRVQISHLKASGRSNWHKQQTGLATIAPARRNGISVLADAYPYTAYGTSLTILLPGQALEGGTGGMLRRLRDAGWREAERRALDLGEAVRKMTSMPADQIGLRDRGRIAPGQKADVVVFDAARVKDMATFEQPRQYPLGIPHVLVNGVAVVENGRHRAHGRDGRCAARSRSLRYAPVR